MGWIVLNAEKYKIGKSSVTCCILDRVKWDIRDVSVDIQIAVSVCVQLAVRRIPGVLGDSGFGLWLLAQFLFRPAALGELVVDRSF